MSNRPIGMGFIGTGGISQSVHLPAYKKLQDEGKVKIVAICDINEETLRSVAEKHEVSQTFTDYKKMLELPGIDAVDICTPNYMHMPPTVDSFAAGKHVIVEKPIGLNSVEGAKMVEAGKKAGKKLQIALNSRFNSAPQAVKRFIRDGKLGDIYFARAKALRRRGIPGWGVFTQKDKQGGGPLIDIGVHILDLTLWLMDYPEPASVSGAAYTKFGTREGVIGLMGQWDPSIYTVEDFAVGMVRFKNGASLTLESSFVANIERDEFNTSVMGTEGGAFLTPGDPSRTKIFREESGTLTDTDPVFLPSINSYESEIRSYISAIADNTPVEVPGEQGLMVSRILDAIYASSEAGKEIVF